MQQRSDFDKDQSAVQPQVFSGSGIPLKSFYTPTDLETSEPEDIGLPGNYPFTRGGEASWESYKAGKSRYAGMGFGLPEDTRKRLDLVMSSSGLDRLNIYTDMPTYHGYDPDDPMSRGRVGQSGVSISNTQDLAKIFDDIPIDKIFVSINTPFSDMGMLALYIAYAEKRGIPRHKLIGGSNNRMYKASFGSNPSYPPDRTVRCIASMAEYCFRNLPQWMVMNSDAYGIREQGGNAIQELAFQLAVIIGITEQIIKDGYSADDYLSRISFRLNISNDFFEEIAKFRAFRKTWAKISQERFGCVNPKALNPEWVLAHTGGATMTAQQPLNNIIRSSVETLAAIIGGIPWVHTVGYDEALGLPTENAATIAMRVQQILVDENGVKGVVDPMGGSYYIEYLTKKVEEGVYELLHKVDQRGGFSKCWEQGWFRSQIEMEATKFKEMVENKEKLVVGVNEYVMDQKTEVPVFRIDPQAEKIMIERAKVFKGQRDQKKVESSLDKVREIAKCEGELMPVLIEAARVDATLGEMMNVLREVFGWRVYR